ncbi:oligosaccharide flippase family protein [Sphingomonas aracearum]|uniref:oligosaccharide flippase family protein n=1 Tax=Sphingomonas aracearum TaxID=2283317 RepID=UPI0015F08EB3|nr:oligosaccharide flippase family protein [Sphingomonas aracearum]
MAGDVPSGARADVRERLKVNALWAVFGQGSSQILSLCIFLVLARYVSKESFGLVAVSLATVELVRRLFLDSVATAVLAQGSRDPEERDAICLAITSATGLVAAVAVFAGADLLAALLDTPGLAGVLRVFSVILLLMGLTATPGMRLARSIHFRSLALRALLSVCAGGAVGLTLALAGYGLASLIAQQLAINLVNCATLWLASGFRPRGRLRWATARHMLERARHLSISAAWNFLAADVDLFLATAFFGPAGAGLYNAAKRILLAANMMLVDVISNLSIAAFANISEEDQRRAGFLGALRWALLVTAPAFAGLAVVAHPVIRLLMGETWEASAAVLSALAVSGIALALSQVAGATMIAADRPDSEARIAMFSAFFVSAALLLFGRASLEALALTFSLATAVVLPARLYRASSIAGARLPEVLALWPPLAAAGLMAGAVWIVQLQIPASAGPLATLIVGVLTGIVTYAACLRLLLPRDDRALLRAMVRTGRKRGPAASVPTGTAPLTSAEA